MLLRIAWRNIWRNRRRSIIVIGSIVVGVVAAVMNDGLSTGMIHQMLHNQIGTHVSHIQIHKRGFNDNKIIQSYIPDPARVERALENTADIEAWSKRVITFGLLSSAQNSSGGVVVGVQPEREALVTTISESIVEGEYLSGGSHEVVIGRELADKLDVELGDKVVGMASAISGKVGADLFRVVGIFETLSTEFDKTYMFISLASAQQMLELGDNVSEFAMVCGENVVVDSVQIAVTSQLDDDYEVLSYSNLLPMLMNQMQMYEQMMFIIYLIVGIAMVFGIINTMLMSVFERIQEFGVLMAIGMKNSRLFSMIMIEAFFLGIIGTVLGLVCALLINWPLSATGIDLSMFAEGLKSFGAGAIIYPVITSTTIINAIVIIPLVTVVGALYPAVKAMRLEPMYAIRYV